MTKVSLPGRVLNSESSAVTFLVCDSDTHCFMHLHRVIFHRENEVIIMTYFPEDGMARSECSQTDYLEPIGELPLDPKPGPGMLWACPRAWQCVRADNGSLFLRTGTSNVSGS